MPTFKSSVSIEQPPEVAFEFLCDLRNVPRYLDAVTSVEDIGEGRIRVRIDVGGQATVTDGTFRVHEGHRRRVEWTVDGPDEYSGWLEVDPEGEVCSVTAEVRTNRESELDADLDRALFALKNELDAL
ncbi:MAG: hypothetical protein NVSMB12_08300 [Acidimicrobiales bacterium]